MGWDSPSTIGNIYWDLMVYWDTQQEWLNMWVNYNDRTILTIFLHWILMLG